jgi:hypothetical protein
VRDKEGTKEHIYDIIQFITEFNCNPRMKGKGEVAVVDLSCLRREVG